MKQGEAQIRTATIHRALESRCAVHTVNFQPKKFEPQLANKHHSGYLRDTYDPGWQTS